MYYNNISWQPYPFPIKKKNSAFSTAAKLGCPHAAWSAIEGAKLLHVTHLSHLPTWQWRKMRPNTWWENVGKSTAAMQKRIRLKRLKKIEKNGQQMRLGSQVSFAEQLAQEF